MKKQVTILQENSSPLIIDDTDDRDLKQYTSDLAKILENNNITLLHTSSCSVIIRPHKITSIVVKDLSSEQHISMAQPKKEKQPQEKQSDEKEESDDGIISD